jgi:hypothetical protein
LYLMFKVMGFILKRCINMAKIIVRHEMFNVRRGSFKTSVQSDNFHCTYIFIYFFSEDTKEHNMKQCGLGESDNQTKQTKCIDRCQLCFKFKLF